MKQACDSFTADLFNQVKRGPGRPRKADALTPAQRARAYRARKKAAMGFRDVSRKTDGLRSVVLGQKI